MLEKTCNDETYYFLPSQQYLVAPTDGLFRMNRPTMSPAVVRLGTLATLEWGIHFQPFPSTKVFPSVNSQASLTENVVSFNGLSRENVLNALLR
ncbi:hypothetical protein AVEN_28960-1 [Araneus ventricosus]|uniref:Uncharacterized protein n=1 Tax=Araneus ventricosus TaxID=182803 RepID=A0A4Y2AJJ4_ARAVE|nr:hypothetical protein AVEN_28960-1 [Araneus ventricosus]